MIGGHNVIAIVPARGKSRRLPGKNLANLGGRSLVARAVDAGMGSLHVDRLVVSTDDPAIAEEAKSAGAEVPFLRPAELASDTAPAWAVIEHALVMLGIADGIVVLLQPTSPLRTSDDVNRCLEILLESGAPACISVSALNVPVGWLFKLGDRGLLTPILDQVDQQPPNQHAYALNGAVYATWVNQFLESKTLKPGASVAYVMSAERSIDVDTKEDLERAEKFLVIAEGSSGSR